MTNEIRTNSLWTPSLGAWADNDGVRFRVWAPHSKRVDVMYDCAGAPAAMPLEPLGDGTFGGWIPGISSGATYSFQLDGERVLPDPASRYQPDGVRGPSAIVDGGAFPWTDASWRGRTLADLLLYELHVGAFSEAGTFAGLQSKLEYLRLLGITAIELMPLAEFAGSRNWGYDGVFLFAPSHRYGHPDDLRRVVDAAHRLGIAVLLDVVYNHIGPDGACWTSYTPRYFSDRHRTPWGAAVNFDGDDAARVRELLIENALHWIHEYHVDGLRLDATHQFFDDSDHHFLAELRRAVDDSVANREIILIAEDERHQLRPIEPRANGGFGLDAVWADDFHHEIRRMLAGDCEGYFRGYRGTAAAVADVIERGGYFDAELSDLGRCVICLQNHDQVGNRAFGERLHHQIDPAVYRAASALLLCAPQTPLLFMGQEWAASSPFCYFTDHGADLGRAVSEGRRDEFAAFTAFQDPETRLAIPDPQAERTFASSRLRWPELADEDHRRVFRLYQALLALRRAHAALRSTGRGSVAASAIDDSTLAMWRRAPGEVANPFLVVVRLAGGETVDVPLPSAVSNGRWTTLFCTEDASFVDEPAPIRLELTAATVRVTFARPGAIVLRGASHL